jgi:hypothetical protein
MPDVAVTVSVISSRADAEHRGFSGSPTILINGAEPFAEPARAPAVACRVYRTPAGLRGVPDAAALRAAVIDAARSPGRSQP